MKKSSCSNGSIGITGIITGILIALKLAGIIQCSWLFAFMPFLIGMGIKLMIILPLILWVKWQERGKNGWKY